MIRVVDNIFQMQMPSSAEHHRGRRRRGDAPANDPVGVAVDHDRDIPPAPTAPADISSTNRVT
jgi:hypothetical protein